MTANAINETKLKSLKITASGELIGRELEKSPFRSQNAHYLPTERQALCPVWEAAAMPLPNLAGTSALPILSPSLSTGSYGDSWRGVGGAG